MSWLETNEIQKAILILLDIILTETPRLKRGRGIMKPMIIQFSHPRSRRHAKEWMQILATSMDNCIILFKIVVCQNHFLTSQGLRLVLDWLKDSNISDADVVNSGAVIIHALGMGGHMPILDVTGSTRAELIRIYSKYQWLPPSALKLAATKVNTKHATDAHILTITEFTKVPVKQIKLVTPIIPYGPIRSLNPAFKPIVPIPQPKRIFTLRKLVSQAAAPTPVAKIPSEPKKKIERPKKQDVNAEFQISLKRWLEAYSLSLQSQDFNRILDTLCEMQTLIKTNPKCKYALSSFYQ